jgi:FAD/FMN-containing dehydrogenase
VVGVFGSCPNVGISGFVLGGGHGMITNFYGISAHYLKGVDLFFPNGTSTYVSDDTDKDLMWALRGAGHNLGIATKFYFDFSSID